MCADGDDLVLRNVRNRDQFKVVPALDAPYRCLLLTRLDPQA